MRARHSSLVLCAILALFLASCGKDEKVPEPVVPEKPVVTKNELASVYSKFLSALHDGKWYYYTSQTTGSFSVVFKDKSTIMVKDSLLGCTDATKNTVPSYYKGTKGTWIVNSRDSGVPVSTSTKLEDLIPIWSYFRANVFTLVLNNGTLMHFVSSPERLFDTFAFTLEKNKKLTRLPDKLVESNNVRMIMNDDLDNLVFIPSFDITCKNITVGDIPQVSGVTSHDFSSKVEYTIEMFNGEVYTFMVSALQRGKNFPTLRLTTENGAPILDKVNYVHGTATFLDKSHWYSDVDSIYFDMKQYGIRGRGNSTWGKPKNPYRIKLDEKSKIFGRKKNRDWVLLANYSDKSLMRNMVAMRLSELLQMPWTPCMLPVQVYLNGDYIGLYNFSEQKEVANDRVDIDVAAGDVYLEIEQAMDEPTCFYSSLYAAPIMFSDPEYPSSDLLVSTRKYINDFEKALDSDKRDDPLTGYANYIDVKTFVDNYIIQELVKNIDGNIRKSSFLTRHNGGKLVMYHVWDFDLTLGNCDYMDKEFRGGGGLPSATNYPTGWYIKDYGRTDYGTGKGWYKTLMKDPDFVAAVKIRWNEMKPQLDLIPQYIDLEYSLISSAADMNFERYQILGTYVWPNFRVFANYKDEVTYLKQFYTERLEWLDKNINAL